MKICVFGGASAAIDNKFIVMSEKLGEELAARGHTLIFGGGAVGPMGAVARGVKKNGGQIISVVPTFMSEQKERHILLDKPDVAIYTDTLHERKAIMENTADAFIAIPGGFGTFDELFEVLTIRQLRCNQKPIAVFDVDGYFKEFGVLASKIIELGFANEECLSIYKVFDNVDALLDYIDKPNV